MAMSYKRKEVTIIFELAVPSRESFSTVAEEIVRSITPVKFLTRSSVHAVLFGRFCFSTVCEIYEKDSITLFSKPCRSFCFLFIAAMHRLTILRHSNLTCLHLPHRIGLIKITTVMKQSPKQSGT